MVKYDKSYVSKLVRLNIRKYRKLRNFTKQELADLTDYSHQYLKDLEYMTCTKTPTLEALSRFANALNIEINQLFDEDVMKDKDN